MSGFWNSDSKRALAGETPSQTGVVFLRSWRTVGTPLLLLAFLAYQEKTNLVFDAASFIDCFVVVLLLLTTIKNTIIHTDRHV